MLQGVSGAGAKLLDMGGEVEVIAGFQYEMLDVPNDGYLDFYLWPKYSPHGYVWMIPKEGGRANVGLVTTDKKGAIKYLESFIQDTYLADKPTVNPPWRAEGIKVRPFGGTIPISGPRDTTVGDGVMLVGDAAGFTSPLFEGGTHLALWSGREAAQTLAAALKENDLSKDRLMAYERAWKKRFPPLQQNLEGKNCALRTYRRRDVGHGEMPPSRTRKHEPSGQSLHWPEDHGPTSLFVHKERDFRLAFFRILAC
jgi:digeranylgeranylglycerophospholipid reductase